MKILYIIRHAKSDWADDNLHDRERPLSPRGLRDAPVMAQRLVSHNNPPLHILSSPAVRAYTTCSIFCEALAYDIKKVQVEQELYFGDVQRMIELIEGALIKHERIAVFGHNPNSSILAHYWCGSFMQDIPTCAIVAIGFEGAPGMDKGKLLWYDFPKNQASR